MIHECALEPELVATWGRRRDSRYFVEKFRLGQPRIISRYPERWRNLVWEAFQARRSTNDMERTRIEALLSQLSERMVCRHNYIWGPDQTWLENAHREHARFPFHLILARANATGHPSTLIAEELDDTTALWMAPRGVTVARSANEMATIAATMLRLADVIIFVDPYFRPGRPQNSRPLEAFLHAVVNGRPIDTPSRVEVHTSLKYENAPSLEFFRTECERRLPRCVPEGMQLTIRVLKQKAGGDLLHNRYVLTDVGGLKFGVGLDEGVDGETDDVSLLDRAEYEKRWAQYAGDSIAFDVVGLVVEIRSRR